MGTGFERSSRLSKIRWWFVVRGVAILLGVVLVGYTSYLFWADSWKIRVVGYDYAFFYYAFQAALHHHSALQLYDSSAEQAFLKGLGFPFMKHNQYVYPPQFALLWSPLGMLSFIHSVIVWMAISAAAYIIALYWLIRMSWPQIRRKRAWLFALIGVCLEPFQNDIIVGNVNSIILACVALTFYLLYYRRKSWWAGIPLGLAIVFKVTPIAVLVYLLLRKQWRTSASALMTSVVVSGCTALWFGSFSLLYYAKSFLSFGQTSMKNGPAPYNQSLLGVLGMFVQHHWLHLSSSRQMLIFLMYAAVVAALILYVVLRTHADWRLDIALASLSPILFSPLVEQMHMLYVVPTLIVLISLATHNHLPPGDTARRKSIGLWTVTLLSVVILSVPGVVGINVLANSMPLLFWARAGMFLVAIVLFATTVWKALGGTKS